MDAGEVSVFGEARTVKNVNFNETSCKVVIDVEPSGVQALKNANPLKDVEALAVLVVAVLV